MRNYKDELIDTLRQNNMLSQWEEADIRGYDVGGEPDVWNIREEN